MCCEGELLTGARGGGGARFGGNGRSQGFALSKNLLNMNFRFLGRRWIAIDRVGEIGLLILPGSLLLFRIIESG